MELFSELDKFVNELGKRSARVSLCYYSTTVVFFLLDKFGKKLGKRSAGVSLRWDSFLNSRSLLKSLARDL